MKRTNAVIRSNVAVSCPCGWSGFRVARSTQPCPGCEKPIDATATLAKRSEINRRHVAKKAREEQAIGIVIAQRNAAAHAADREEDERIGALLRSSTDEFRPAPPRPKDPTP